MDCYISFKSLWILIYIFGTCTFAAVEKGYVELNGNRYYISEVKATWPKAMEFCKGIGMDLAVIESEYEVNKLVEQINKLRKWSLLPYIPSWNYWLGARNSRDNALFYESAATGQPLVYSKWLKNEPTRVNLERQAERCVFMHNHASKANCQYTPCEGSWQVTTCNERYRYVCKRLNNGNGASSSSKGFKPVVPERFPASSTLFTTRTSEITTASYHPGQIPQITDESQEITQIEQISLNGPNPDVSQVRNSGLQNEITINNFSNTRESNSGSVSTNDLNSETTTNSRGNVFIDENGTDQKLYSNFIGINVDTLRTNFTGQETQTDGTNLRIPINNSGNSQDRQDLSRNINVPNQGNIDIRDSDESFEDIISSTTTEKIKINPNEPPRLKVNNYGIKSYRPIRPYNK